MLETEETKQTQTSPPLRIWLFAISSAAGSEVTKTQTVKSWPHGHYMGKVLLISLNQEFSLRIFPSHTTIIKYQRTGFSMQHLTLSSSLIRCRKSLLPLV